MRRPARDLACRSRRRRLRCPKIHLRRRRLGRPCLPPSHRFRNCHRAIRRTLPARRIQPFRPILRLRRFPPIRRVLDPRGHYRRCNRRHPPGRATQTRPTLPCNAQRLLSSFLAGRSTSTKPLASDLATAMFLTIATSSQPLTALAFKTGVSLHSHLVWHRLHTRCA
jgi:hypothetical protein